MIISKTAILNLGIIYCLLYKECNDIILLSLSFLEIDEFDGECKDGEEDEDEGKEHRNRNSDHARAISKAYFQVFFHRPLETLPHSYGVYVAKLRRYNSPQRPCNRADVVEPNPPSWEALINKNRTEEVSKIKPTFNQSINQSITSVVV